LKAFSRSVLFSAIVERGRLQPLSNIDASDIAH